MMIQFIRTIGWNITNPHDRFSRAMLGDPFYASDFLLNYTPPVLNKYVDFGNLITAPTHYLSKQLKEVVLDISFLTSLRDAAGSAEVVIFQEHKSQLDKKVILQLWWQSGLAMYSGWAAQGLSASYQPPIPLMIVIYNGNDECDFELNFHDLYPYIPDELKPYVPQCRVIFINLKRFHYGSLPGKPETQAIVESMKRATDGTFAANLPNIIQHVGNAELNEEQIQDLVTRIVIYGTWVSNLTSQQIYQSITNVFKGQRGVQMAETIEKSILQEGIEMGEVKVISAILQKRFNKVPQNITDSLGQRTDVVALESLVVLAATCKSLDEFAEALK